MFLKFIKRIDFFAKRPGLYFKQRSRKTSWIGTILTFLYAIIFILFLAYKLNRMINRMDVTVYDTNSYTGEIPSIQINKDLFYAGIAFDIPGTDIPYIDERIYTIETKFVSQIKVNGQWKTNETVIPMKRCELSDFGSNYKDIFETKDLSQMLCPTNVNYALEGYSTMEKYSYVKMNFKRCVNTSENNNHCFPMDVIQQYLYATNIDARIQDIELTPRSHDNPIHLLERDIPGPTYKDLHLMIFVYMQIVIIETDDNIIGFEALSEIKTEKYLKYDTTWIIPSPNLYGDFTVNPDAPLNDITMQLSPSVLILRRTYVKLIDILGDIGGLMATINMIFSTVSSFIVNILYEKSLVNNLFNFNLDRKIVIFKHRKNKNNNIKYNYVNKENNIFNILKNHSNIGYDETNIIDEGLKDIMSLDKKIIKNIDITKQKNKFDIKKELYSSQSNISLNQKENKALILNLNNINNEINIKKNYSNKINVFNKNKIYNNNYNKEKEHHHTDENSEKSKNIIKEIKINKFYVYCCFYFIRNVSTVNNILLDEGMKLIMERLDIFNLFMQLYENFRREEHIREENIKLEMSYDCKKKLSKKIKNDNNFSSYV